MAKSGNKKKEKITYIDDGRTIADMSGLGRKPSTNDRYGYASRSVSTWKEKLQTFFDAMKMMFLPTLVMVGFLCVLFLILYFIF